ncbi:cyclic nucleotide-binding domain-containing protein [Terasakiella sp. SH-1]|uniref:cyclic nucleotide-binding domain-containing protein n=1 Tax=Terasakiella sp. SH-1 TaxID=2560057 RepID=UPI001074578B|nr:cyclic nucleotide-binding domain-containing protein [Terasakiella sp. SH-1]
MAEYRNKEFKKGDYILKEGDPPTYAYILKQGSVEVIKQRTDGGEILLQVLKAGEIFGEMSMVDFLPRSASVRALEDVSVIVVDPPTFNQKQEALDIFTKNLVRTLIARLREQNQMIADMTEPSFLTKAAKKGQIETNKVAHTSVLFKEDYRDKLNFSSIRFLLADANSQSRQSIKGGLHMQGFREIEEAGNFIDFRNRIQGNELDLIIVDNNLGTSNVAQVIRDIRQGKGTVSPFCMIFAIIDQPEPSVLEVLSEAGLDDVLVKPVALGNIMDRVERRIRKRKPFVVTLDYVGPDRRSSIRQGSEEIPLVDVPNPLAFKALPKQNEKDYLLAHQEAMARIEMLKIERYVVQVGWLCKKVSSLRNEHQNPAFFLDKMIEITRELGAKLEKKGNESHVSICQVILSMIDDFQAGTADMSGPQWDDFTSVVGQLTDELGPKA